MYLAVVKVSAAKRSKSVNAGQNIGAKAVKNRCVSPPARMEIAANLLARNVASASATKDFQVLDVVFPTAAKVHCVADMVLANMTCKSVSVAMDIVGMAARKRTVATTLDVADMVLATLNWKRASVRQVGPVISVLNPVVEQTEIALAMEFACKMVKRFVAIAWKALKMLIAKPDQLLLLPRSRWMVHTHQRVPKLSL